MAKNRQIEGVIGELRLQVEGWQSEVNPWKNLENFKKKIKKIKNKMRMKMKKMKNLEGDKHPLWNTFYRGGGYPPLCISDW